MFDKIRAALPTVPPELATVGATGAICWGLATLQRQADEAAHELANTLDSIAHHSRKLAELTEQCRFTTEARDEVHAAVRHLGEQRTELIAEVSALSERRDALRETSGVRCTHGDYKACSCTDPECGHPVHSWPAADTDPLAKGENDG